MREVDSKPAQCGVCGGQGEVWQKSKDKDVLVSCPGCKGSGEKEDRLHKVMPMEKPTLLK